MVRPRVTVICLGGTIASVPVQEGEGVAPRLRGESLLASVPALERIAELEVVDLATIPSWELTFDHVVAVRDAILEASASGADGVVVVQGSDTMEEVSFGVDLLLDEDIPVAFVAAMRHPGKRGADGDANLVDAVRTVLHPKARGLGCLVVMNEEIHHSRFVRKRHASALGAFESGDAGPCGWMREGIPHFLPRSLRSLTIALAPGIPVLPPPLVRITLDDSGWWIAGVREARAGLVIEGMGGGHVPGWIGVEVGRLAMETPVILASRTGDGAVLTRTYALPGSESSLLQAGVIPAGDLGGLKARVLLGMLLARGAGRQEIREAFALVGEG